MRNLKTINTFLFFLNGFLKNDPHIFNTPGWSIYKWLYNYQVDEIRKALRYPDG